jgi:hypothetical protein
MNPRLYLPLLTIAITCLATASFGQVRFLARQAWRKTVRAMRAD